MEKGGGLSHRTPAYNASAAEFYKLYSLQTCSDKPSATNPRKTSYDHDRRALKSSNDVFQRVQRWSSVWVGAWGECGANSNLSMVREELMTNYVTPGLDKYVSIISLGDEIEVGRPLMGPGKAAGSTMTQEDCDASHNETCPAFQFSLACVRSFAAQLASLFRRCN